MPQPIEAGIIANAQAGDRQAFRSIVEQYQGFLYAVAYRYFGHAEEAEDAVQETFIKVWKNLSRYRPEVKLSTWLYKILVNHCMDMFKSTAQRGWRSQQELSAARHLPAYEAKEWEYREAMDLVTEAASHLPEKQKWVFVLRDLQGLNVREVGGIMDLGEDRVKSNLYHARKKVSEYVQRH
ncbi:MAG: sigma-70 family RNA polymerase sigma factor [Cyclobacteriaceae bacterium]|jgi:RNA polymerase sigma-70 factor (ECF subfamily)|nr:sigma-70 family RNA polymerase sigma factor [Cyclobacteriaceae bacterium]